MRALQDVKQSRLEATLLVDPVDDFAIGDSEYWSVHAGTIALGDVGRVPKCQTHRSWPN